MISYRDLTNILKPMLRRLERLETLESPAPIPPETNTYSLDLEAGSSQYAFITDAAQAGLDITGSITLEAWVKIESAPGVGITYSIISKLDGDGGASLRQYRLAYRDLAGVKQLIFSVSSDGTGANTQHLALAQDLNTAIWKHVAAVWDAADGDVDFYVDGLLVGNVLGTLAVIANTTTPFTIGCNLNVGVGENFFDGLIDEIRVWNINRTSIQVLNNLQVDVTGQANLQAYWKLNNVYSDAGPNGNTLTPTGSPVFSIDVPFVNY